MSSQPHSWPPRGVATGMNGGGASSDLQIRKEDRCASHFLDISLFACLKESLPFYNRISTAFHEETRIQGRSWVMI